jgi:hypothetical protein
MCNPCAFGSINHYEQPWRRGEDVRGTPRWLVPQEQVGSGRSLLVLSAVYGALAGYEVMLAVVMSASWLAVLAALLLAAAIGLFVADRAARHRRLPPPEAGTPAAPERHPERDGAASLPDLDVLQ